jgi:hypothetical protein
VYHLVWGVLVMTHIHSLPAEWLSVSIAPSDGDLEVCVMDYDGMETTVSNGGDVGCEGFSNSFVESRHTFPKRCWA